MKSQEKDSRLVSGSSEAPKNNCFYALHIRGDKETSPNIMTCLLKVFFIDVYALLDPGDTI